MPRAIKFQYYCFFSSKTSCCIRAPFFLIRSESDVLRASSFAIKLKRFFQVRLGVAIVDVRPLPNVVAFAFLKQRPCVPAPAGHAYLTEVVTPFCFGGDSPKVVRRRLRHLAFAQLLAYAERAEVVCVIAQSGVFPVDEVGVPVFVDEEVQAEEVCVYVDADAKNHPIGNLPNETICYLILEAAFRSRFIADDGQNELQKSGGSNSRKQVVRLSSRSISAGNLVFRLDIRDVRMASASVLRPPQRAGAGKAVFGFDSILQFVVERFGKLGDQLWRRRQCLWAWCPSAYRRD